MTQDSVAESQSYQKELITKNRSILKPFTSSLLQQSRSNSSLIFIDKSEQTKLVESFISPYVNRSSIISDRNLVTNNEEEEKTCNTKKSVVENELIVHTILELRVKILFTLLGLGTLCAYNTVISAIDWFEYIHPHDSSSSSNNTNLESSIAASGLAAQTITTLILLYLSSVSSSSASGTATNRLYAGFYLEIILLFLFAVTIPSESTILTISFLTGIGTAISQSGAYAIAAVIDAQCAAYVSFGSALAGFFSSGLRLLIKAIFYNNERLDSFVFFFFNCVFMGICVYATKLVSDLNQEDDEESERRKPEDRVDEAQNISDIAADRKNSYWKTFQHVWPVLFSMCFNFFVTLGLFPGVISTLPSSGLIGDKWFAIVLITIFNLFDCVGRAFLSDSFGSTLLLQALLYHNHSPSASQKQNFYYLVFWPCALRVLFIPFLVLVKINSDIFNCLILAFLGFSNGFIASACFMVGPELVNTFYWKETVSLWLLLALYLGLLIGAFLGMYLA